MASANFNSFDRTLRRMYMLNLVENLSKGSGEGFKASLVVNAHTGLPVATASDVVAPILLARHVRTIGAAIAV